MSNATLPAVERMTLQARSTALSGLWCVSPQGSSRGLVIALHGAGYGAEYWAYANPGEPSLLQLGALLGYEVVALDRPGYGSAQHICADACRLESQAELLFEAIDSLRRQRDATSPVFLLGHSVGGALALLMASARPDRITAVDVLGVPFRFAATPDGVAIRQLIASGTHLPPIGDDERKAWLFGPSGTYDQRALEVDRDLVRPIPILEYADAMDLPGRWAEVLPRITVPVQYTVVQHECMQETGPRVLTDVEALLRRCPLPRLVMQRHASHNASMSHMATAFHLRAFAFFSEAVVPSVRRTFRSADVRRLPSMTH